MCGRNLCPMVGLLVTKMWGTLRDSGCGLTSQVVSEVKQSILSFRSETLTF